MTPGERHARLLFAPFQSSPQSFPKNELGLRSSYPTPRRKCPDVDQLEFRFMPDLRPNAEGSVHSTNTMTAKNVLPAHSHSVTRPRPGWRGLHSKLWDKWPYLSCSFSFVTRRYSLVCLCMYVFSPLKCWIEMKFRLWGKYEWNRSDPILFEVKKEKADFPPYITRFCHGVWTQNPSWPFTSFMDFVGRGDRIEGGFGLVVLVKFHDVIFITIQLTHPQQYCC